MRQVHNVSHAMKIRRNLALKHKTKFFKDMLNISSASVAIEFYSTGRTPKQSYFRIPVFLKKNFRGRFLQNFKILKRRNLYRKSGTQKQSIWKPRPTKQFFLQCHEDRLFSLSFIIIFFLILLYIIHQNKSLEFTFLLLKNYENFGYYYQSS